MWIPDAKCSTFAPAFLKPIPLRAHSSAPMAPFSTRRSLSANGGPMLIARPVLLSSVWTAISAKSLNQPPVHPSRSRQELPTTSASVSPPPPVSRHPPPRARLPAMGELTIINSFKFSNSWLLFFLVFVADGICSAPATGAAALASSYLAPPAKGGY